MGIRSFCHKIKTCFLRMFGTTIPYVSEMKEYGSCGESMVEFSIKSSLPECQIKRNVIVQTEEGSAEIDCLCLYKNKLFAIEIKRWKGTIQENDGYFVQRKLDQWTGEIHTKTHKSPFKQLGRAVYLLKKQIPDKAWINTVVFFEEGTCDFVSTEAVWFSYADELISYITNDGKECYGNNALQFFSRCTSADTLCASGGKRTLQCVICDDSLLFNTAKRRLTRKDIASISIYHHWYYDDLYIETKSGKIYDMKLENAYINVVENGFKSSYAICKLDNIQLG